MILITQLANFQYVCKGQGCLDNFCNVFADKSKQAKTQEESTPAKEEEFSPGSPQENEFVSDAFQENELSAEEVRKEMQMLGVDEELPAKDADGKFFFAQTLAYQNAVDIC